jgi:Zn-dependent protease
MRASWKIGSAFGIGIYIHITFLLLPLIVLFETGTQAGVGVLALSMGLVLALFGCVVLHELGHALMARYFAIGTRDITLYPIGGVARLEGMGKRPFQELCIALAGPAVNVVIAAVLGILMIPLVDPTRLLEVSTSSGLLSAAYPLESFLYGLLFLNVGMVIFNMIPAFPMDGGRVLRSLLAMRIGQMRATEIAVRVGTVFAVIMVFLGVFGGEIGFGSPMLAVVAVFIWFAGQQELYGLRMREQIRRAAPIDVLPADDNVEFALTPPQEPDYSGYTWNSRLHAWVLWRNGRAVAAFSVPME